MPTWSMQQAEAHLRHTDAVMRQLIDQWGPCPLLDQATDLFDQLIVAIINQRISYSSADAVEKRVRASVPQFTAQAFASVTEETLRSAGLSYRKAQYILSVSQAVRDGELGLGNLAGQSNETVMRRLTALKGIGPWTAQMVLLFGLERPDVVAPGDVGLQRATAKLYGDTIRLEDKAPDWSPYCSVASWYLWQSLRHEHAASA